MGSGTIWDYFSPLCSHPQPGEDLLPCLVRMCDPTILVDTESQQAKERNRGGVRTERRIPRGQALKVGVLFEKVEYIIWINL